MACHFKFKPDKIKYLSTIDTLDSSHKQFITSVHDKRTETNKKQKALEKLMTTLTNIDKSNKLLPNYIKRRTKILDDIKKLKQDLEEIENYEEELNYYEKTHQIILNYYDCTDSNQIINTENREATQVKEATHVKEATPVKEATQVNKNVKDTKSIDYVWTQDDLEIFNKNSNSVLELLNQKSKLKRKEKVVTKKRVRVTDPIKTENNIYDFLEGATNKTKKQNVVKNVKLDKTSLFSDYNTALHGYNTKKKIGKQCINCGEDKSLQPDGFYACVECGEVENCLIENETTNFKDPMIEKPTFPYKRKNHFCE